MIAPNLISDAIQPLHTDDSGEDALLKMREYNLNQLPVVTGRAYNGIVTLEEIVHSEQLQRPLSEIVKKFRQPQVLTTAHIFEVMKAAVEYNVRIVPVVSEEQMYIGLVTAESCLRSFAVLNSLTEPGGTIELEIEKKDYRVSELARIVEENEAEILCLYSHRNPETHLMEITIKVNTTDISAIVSSFERYNYEVKSVYNEVEYSEDLKDRYDALMRYLNV